MTRPCRNCGDLVTERSDREGLIHKGPKIGWGNDKGEKVEWLGRYGCSTGRGVAE